MIYVDETTATLYYRTFSTATDSWGTATAIATGVTVPDGYYKNLKRSRGIASLALDANDVPHVVYATPTTIFYRNRIGGGWSAPQTVASGGYPYHEQLAFGADGTLHLSWLDDSSSPSVMYARRTACGAWQPPETVSTGDVQQNDTGDQGPSIVVASSGAPYVLWTTPRPADAVRIKYRTSGGSWVYDPLPEDLYTHAPQIYARGNDLYAVLGHDDQIRFGYQAHLAGQPWSPYVAISSTANGTLDGSASVRWDPQRETDPAVIDAAYFDEDERDDATTYLPKLMYTGIVPAGTGGGDSAPPSVSLISPVAGGTVSGAVSVAAIASDDTGVAGVRFQIDGVDLGGEDTTAPYEASWNTTTVADGAHTVAAIARDAAGNVASTSVGITVANGSLPPPPASSGPVAAYSFDAGTGTTVADASGNGNTGSLAGASWAFAGRYGGALSFNGSSSLVTVADSPSLDLTTGMTLEAWVNPTALGATWRTVCFKEQPGGMVYSLYANQSTSLPVGQVNMAGEQNATGPSSLPVGTWTHLAVTFDGSSLRLYMNGVLVRTLAVGGSNPTSGGPLRIGGNGVWPEWFAGLIDEVRVYSRALTAGEVLADMATPIGGGSPPPPPPSGDTTPPSVEVTAPTAGAIVWGTTTVSARASDDVGVVGVQFLVDGANLGAEDTTEPFSTAWDTTAGASGSHALTAAARDAAGNRTTSNAVVVQVSKRRRPQ